MASVGPLASAYSFRLLLVIDQSSIRQAVACPAREVIAFAFAGTGLETLERVAQAERVVLGTITTIFVRYSRRLPSGRRSFVESNPRWWCIRFLASADVRVVTVPEGSVEPRETFIIASELGGRNCCFRRISC